MNFNSVEYLLFVPLIFLFLVMVPRRFSWLVFLVGSCYFYLSLKHPTLLLALALVTAATYPCGILLGRRQSVHIRRAVFWGGVAANLLVLIAMRYLPFLTGNLNALARGLGMVDILHEAAPVVAIGVSYYVFQAVSYLIDIYMGTAEPEPHPGIFALYLCFFPKLLQGPIERAGDLIPQLRMPFRFDQENFSAGLLLFAWGLFKKGVVADRLAPYVNAAYGDIHGHSGIPLLVATYIYALQIYYDFSGYTDMALGTARMFNVRLTRNFNAPYLATSVADFWRRWHISFSRWILDYVFMPLQFAWRDWRKAGTAAALLVTFLISGLWHGASWCFIIWGGLHGFYLAASVLFRPLQKRVHQLLRLGEGGWLRIWRIAATFHLVCLAWVFFRSTSPADAWYVLTHLFGGVKGVWPLLLEQGETNLAIVSCSLAVIWTLHWLGEKTPVFSSLITSRTWCRWCAYAALGAILLLFNTGSRAGFIYFRF